MAPPTPAKITPRQKAGIPLDRVMALPLPQKCVTGRDGDRRDYPQHQYEQPDACQHGPPLESKARLHEEQQAPEGDRNRSCGHWRQKCP